MAVLGHRSVLARSHDQEAIVGVWPHGNSEGRQLPFDKAFFAGGANDIRGWLARTLGPGSYSNPSFIENGGDIKLCGLQPDVRSIFDLTRLIKVLDVFLTRAEAVAAWG